jgi:hypothetical protein
MKILTRILQIIAAGILLQTLFFKFTAAPESVYIFKTLEAEPYGRLGSGIIELIASVLILIPRTTLLGALIGSATMTGALLSHFFILGTEVQNDGGTLFLLGIITFICCLLLIYMNKNKLPNLLKFKL